MAPRLMALLALLVLKGHLLPVLDQLLSLPALNCLPLLQVTSNRLLLEGPTRALLLRTSVAT
jgi:hypothetical protein